MDYELFDADIMKIIMELNQVQLSIAGYHAKNKDAKLKVMDFLVAVDNMRHQLMQIIED